MCKDIIPLLNFDNKNPLVSIIVPCYNGEKYIHRCIESILTQSYKNLEIIIIDDGSSDNSYEILKEIQNKDNRVQILKQENQGPSVARNKGIETAQGYWITFIDIDDKVENNYIANFIPQETYEDLKIQGFTFVKDEIQDKVCLSKNKITYTNIGKCITDIFLLHRGSVWGKLFKTNIINDNNIRFDKNWIYKEDLIFLLQYLQFINQIQIIPTSSYLYYINDNSITRSHFKAEYLIYNQSCILKLINNFIDISPEYIGIFNTFCLNEQLDAIYRHYIQLYKNRDRIDLLKKIQSINNNIQLGNKFKSNIILTFLLKNKLYLLFDYLCHFIYSKRYNLK